MDELEATNIALQAENKRLHVEAVGWWRGAGQLLLLLWQQHGASAPGRLLHWLGCY